MYLGVQMQMRRMTGGLSPYHKGSAVEKELIRTNSLPLNIKDNDHPFVEINKARCKAIREKCQRVSSEDEL